MPAGGLSPDGTRWIHARPRFFLPVQVLSQVFRGKFIAGLRQAYRQGRLAFPGRAGAAQSRRRLSRLPPNSLSPEWVVYAKPPFGGPEHVLHYLARYTHRVAISNHRLVDVTDDTVTFRWKDYRHGSQVADAHARRRRVSPPLLAARPTEALRPHPLLRLPRVAVSDPATRTVSPGPGGDPDAPTTAL